MLTPQDVKNKEFTKVVFGGYDMTSVDEYFETLSEDYASLYKESAILKNKLKVLVDKVEEYRSTEDSMRMALLTAQKMAQDLIDDATAKSEKIIEEAETSARERIESLKIDVLEEELRLQEAKKNTAEFVRASEELCKKQIDFLSKLNELVIDIPRPEPKAADTAMQEQIDSTAKSIEDSLSKIFESSVDSDDDAIGDTQDYSLNKPEDTEPEEEEVKIFSPAEAEAVFDDVEEPTSPKPKFNFTNLQFGSNYNQDDKTAKKK